MLLSELLSRKPTVILDGAMGTELHRLGVDIGLPLWSANALLRAPHIIRNVHYHYLHAGSDILTTDTFRSNIRALRKAECEDRWEELNLRAVELAFEARDRYRSSRPVLIAGGLAPVEDCYSPELVPARDELLEEHGKQAELLSMFGVDMLLVETMMSIRESSAAAEACAATGKEFAVSFVCANEGLLLSGETLEDAVKAVAPFQPTALMVNCTSALHIGSAHRLLKTASVCTTGCYANTSTPAKGDLTVTRHDVSAEEYAEASVDWVKDGARIIGGCCGTGPEHITLLARLHAAESLQQQEDDFAAWTEAMNNRRSRPPAIDLSDPFVNE
jgi:S-methylmethionine-dependent homocysteine/selenocysteine methylase